MRRLFISLMLALSVVSPAVLVAAPAYATDSQGQVCQGIGLAGGNCNDKSGDKGIANLAKSIVNILSIVVGIAAVIMIIIAGLKYVTSGGDSSAISSAKSTLIYAVVGLVVALLAQFIVHYVIVKLT